MLASEYTYSPYQTDRITPLKSGLLYASPKVWGLSLGISVSIALILLPWYSALSLWVGVGLLLACLALINMVVASQYILPYPQLAILIGCIQYVLAAWGNHYYPTYHPLHDLGERLPDYLSYAAPSCLLFAIGLLAGFMVIKLVSHNHRAVRETPVITTQFAQELNAIFLVGLATTLLQGVAPSGLKFLFVLLSNMAYVGAFGYVLLNIPGWKFRAGMVIGLLFMKSLQEGMFHDLIVWGASFVLVLAFSRQWSRRCILSAIIGGFLVVLIILSVKEEYRDQFWFGRTYIAESRVGAFSSLVTNVLLNPEILLSDEKTSKTFQRLNQGWIVNRAMVWTPEYEPYAGGRTIVNNVVNSLVPRFLNPHKKVVGGKKDYVRYTGLQLVPGTSMALGYAGEMYVNFGPRWGVLGVGLYGLLIGMGFHWFYARALRHPLWWAWASYFTVIVIKAESSIGYMVNWVLKAAVVMIGVIWFCPAMKQVLWGSMRNTKPSSKLNG